MSEMFVRAAVIPTWILVVGVGALVLPIPETIAGVALVGGTMIVATTAVIRFALATSSQTPQTPRAAGKPVALDADGRELTRMDCDLG